MSPSEPINLKSLVDSIQQVIDEVSAAEVAEELEVQRTEVVRVLSAARDSIRELCYTGDADTEYVAFSLVEDD